MAWNDAAPTATEIGGQGNPPSTVPGSSWNAAPPTPAEMGGQVNTPAAPQDTGAWATTKKVAGAGLDYGLRALDYAGGLSRTAVAGAVSPFTPNGEVVGADELTRMVKGQAPSTSEYMDKMGVPEGAKVSLPLVGDVSARGVGGFLGDVALDPLTYATFGAEPLLKEAAEKAAQKGVGAQAAKTLALEGGEAALEQGAKKLAPHTDEAAAPGLLSKVANTLSPVLNPVGNATEAAGDSLYKSGFKTVDAKLAAKEQAPLSEVMLNNGRPAGTAATMSTEVQKLLDAKMAERQTMYDAINQGGGKVDVLQAMEPSMDRAKEILRIDPNAGPQISGMEDWLQNYGREGQHVPVDLASDWKSRIYNASLPANAYDPLGRALPVASEMKQQFGRGLKEGIEGAAENTLGPGQGARMTQLNSDVGTMINAQKKALPSEVLKSANKNMITPVDAMGTVISATASHSPWAAVPFAIAKKGADAFNTTAGRTYLGNAVSRAGREGMLDAYTRRALIDANQSPWTSMNNGGN